MLIHTVAKSKHSSLLLSYAFIGCYVTAVWF